VKTLGQTSAVFVLILSASLVLGLHSNALADCGFTGGDADAGSAIYHQTCVACHGEDGHGPVFGAPDFRKKGGVLSKPHAILLQHIKNGFREVTAMPPKGGNPGLSDKDIANVHAYLHKQFGCD
jgi:mono/diheme cytochrome c family protein